MSLYGDYDVSEDAVTLESSATMVPVRGHAKSGRHDLKQMILLLATTGAANFPLWMEPHSGNASDKATMPAAAVKIRQLCQGLDRQLRILFMLVIAQFIQIFYRVATIYSGSHVRPKILKKYAH